jgi:molecular chaperone DnaJ
VRDLYEILGVSRDATDAEIKRAYRRRARELHPDAGGDEEQFKELTTAYEVLRNPQARQNYDRYGDPRGPAGLGADIPGFGDLNDLIEAFFGGFAGRSQRAGRAGPQAGRDALIDVALTLEEAAAGLRKDLDITVLRTCEDCRGTGASPEGGPVRCPSCGGTGAVQQMTRSVFGQMLTSTTCPTCRGKGETVTDPCRGCRGAGRLEETETVTIDVPPGVDTSTRLRVAGRGESGRRGGPPGDLYVRVRVADHEVFTRDGDDLHCQLSLPIAQAALGAELKLRTLDGEESLRVPPGTQTGDVLALRRQGMPRLGGGARGDLYVHCLVETPTDLTVEQRELLRRFAELRGDDIGEDGRGFLSRLKGVFGI